MKLVKFNLIVDRQKCRTIAEIKENFNLIDILEHFKSKKLEKWFKARKLDELDALENMKELEDFELMQRLCELFEIDVEESHIRDELIVYQHSLLPKKERDREILDCIVKEKEIENKKPDINHNIDFEDPTLKGIVQIAEIFLPVAKVLLKIK